MTWTPGNMYSGHVPREPHTSWDGTFICTYAPILKYQWLLVVKGSLFPTILSYFIIIILWLYSPFNTTGSAMPGEVSGTLNFRWHDSRIFKFLAWFWDSWIDSCDSYLPKKGSSITWFRKVLNIRKNYDLWFKNLYLIPWFQQWFQEPLMWFGIVVDPLMPSKGIPICNQCMK